MRAVIVRQIPGVLAAVLIYAGGLVAGATLESRFAARSLQHVSSEETANVADLLARNLPLLVVIAVGAITGGFLTLILLLFNGMLVGSLLSDAHAEGQLHESISALFPHAPLELVAILLAGAAGFVPLSVVCRLAVGRTVYAKTEFKDALMLLVTATLFMLPAVMIEAWVTPHVINLTTGGR